MNRNRVGLAARHLLGAVAFAAPFAYVTNSGDDTDRHQHRHPRALAEHRGIVRGFVDPRRIGRALGTSTPLSKMSVKVAGSVVGLGGGAIFSGNTLTVTNCTFTNNSANVGEGGAILSSGTLTVTNSTFSETTGARDPRSGQERARSTQRFSTAPPLHTVAAQTFCSGGFLN
jgi:predicted outer membrane repeat protein